MDLRRLKPVVGSNSWQLLEEYLEEQRCTYLERLISETDENTSNILRGRIRELDNLLRLPSSVSNIK